MNIIKYLTTLMIFLLLTFQISAQKNATLEFPVHLNLENEFKEVFKEFYERGTSSDFLITDKFYPIGWSKTGKFAYLIEPDGEPQAHDCECVAVFVIADLKTDRILWKHEVFSEDFSEENGYWKLKQALFARKLKEHGIQPNKNLSFLRFPIIHQKDELVPKLEIFRTEYSELGYPHNVAAYMVTMVSKEKGKKMVFQRTFKIEEMYKGFLQGHIFGYFLSPYEPRAALLMIEVNGGYEGPPDITRTHIYGVDLVKGFRP
jgi:hypothetical protein